MNVRYRIELSQAERGELTALLSFGAMLLELPVFAGVYGVI
jgi:hypothetical protein